MIPNKLPKLNVSGLMQIANDKSSKLMISDIKTKTDRSNSSEYHVRDQRIQDQIQKFLNDGSAMEPTDSLSVSRF